MEMSDHLLGDAIRDYEREQAVLAVGRRLSAVRMTDAWRSLLTSLIGEETSVESAWQAVVGELLRFLVDVRAITWDGLDLEGVARWVDSLASRHGVHTLTQDDRMALARDIVVTGLMASGEVVRTVRMHHGVLEAHVAPTLVEERREGIYQATYEAMDYCFRNLDYERDYGQVFAAKDVMIKQSVKHGNYKSARDQVQSLRRLISLVSGEYQALLERVGGRVVAAEVADTLRTLNGQMKAISENNDLEIIQDQLQELRAVDDTRAGGGSELRETRRSIGRLMKELSLACEDIRRVMQMRVDAEGELERRFERGTAVRARGATVDLSRLIVAAVEGRVDPEVLVDDLVVRCAMPVRPPRVFGLDALLVDAREGGDGGPAGAIDLSEVVEIEDVETRRREDARASLAASLVASLEARERDDALPLSTWLGSATEEDRFLWLDTGVLRAFLHALHSDAIPEGSWVADALGGRRLALERGEVAETAVDACDGDGTRGWELGFEDRGLRVVG